MNTQEQRFAIAQEVENSIYENCDPLGWVSGTETINTEIDGEDIEITFCFSGIWRAENPADHDLPPYCIADIEYQGTASIYNQDGDKLYDLPVIGRIID